MHIRNGIAYAGNPAPMLHVAGVRPLEDYTLWVRFDTGETRIFDFKPLLGLPAFAPLADADVFRSVYVDYGTAVWNGGDIDIAPETLYEKGVAADSRSKRIGIAKGRLKSPDGLDEYGDEIAAMFGESPQRD